MTTVIGFIPRTGICQSEVILPVGFSEVGKRIEFNNNEFADCKLIFLEDTHYDPEARWDCFQGNRRDALLFQHNSNSSAWEGQQTWLSRNGWIPRHFASFSRTETEGEFMKATKKLLCNNDSNDNCHATVIKNFLQWVEEKNLFKLLDNFVAWEIIRSIKNDKKMQVEEAFKLFELLPNNIKNDIRNLSNDPKEPPPLTKLIEYSNKQVL